LTPSATPATNGYQLRDLPPWWSYIRFLIFGPRWSSEAHCIRKHAIQAHLRCASHDLHFLGQT